MAKDFILPQGGVLPSTRNVVAGTRVDIIGTLCRARAIAKENTDTPALDRHSAPSTLSAESSRLVIQFSGQGVGYLEELREVGGLLRLRAGPQCAQAAAALRLCCGCAKAVCRTACQRTPRAWFVGAAHH